MKELYFFDAHIWSTYYEFRDLVNSSVDVLTEEKLSESGRAVVAFEILPNARKMRDKCEAALLENTRKL